MRRLKVLLHWINGKKNYASFSELFGFVFLPSSKRYGPRFIDLIGCFNAGCRMRSGTTNDTPLLAAERFIGF